MPNVPIVQLPDHSTAAGAGPGQPIHVEEMGQSLMIDPSVPGGVAVDPTSLHPGKYLLVNILNRIFKLLAEMVQSIQDVAVKQSDRLQFLSAWQKVYTDKMGTVHTFIGGNDDPKFISDIGNDSLSQRRQDLNQVNSTYIEQMRSNRSILSDDAKSLQANVNQTTDAVNQQSNMATSIMQQFSTILGAIYR
jgi:hypothetical protein